MADQKLTALTEATSANAGDILYVVTDTGGTPLSLKISKKTLFGEYATTGLLLGYPETDTTITVVYPLTGGGDFSTNRTIVLDTAFLVNTGSLIFAGSGLMFVTYGAEANLTIERVLTAGSSVTIVTDGTAIYINALTNAAGASSVTYASTGAYYVMSETNDANLLVSKLLLAGSSVVVHTDGGAIYVDATTANALAYATTDRSLTAVYPLTGGGTLAGNRTFWVDTAFLLNTGRTITAIYPVSGGGALNVDRGIAIDTAFLVNSGSLYFASSGASFIVFATDNTVDANISLKKILRAGSSVTIDTSAGAIYISATTNATGGAGTVIGSSAAQVIAWYPAVGASVGSSPVSISTGTGIAPWSIPFLIEDPASPSNGDVWILSSGGGTYLRARTNTTTVTVTFA